ncbi:hypothetical protein JCM6882_004901 [Rhodosporidiobolus microsporus]
MAFHSPPGPPYLPPASSPAPPGPNGAPAAPAPASAQAAIEAETRRVVRGWAVGSGLSGVGEVVSHLPPIVPAPTSFFPSPSAPPSSAPPSLQASSAGLVPAEPLFETYAREVAALLGGEGAQETRFKQQEAARLLQSREVRAQVEGVRQGVQSGGNYGALPALRPPHAFTLSAPLPPLQPNDSFASTFLHAASFPLPHPQPAPSSFSIPSIPPHPPSQPVSTPAQAVNAFVAAQLARAQAAQAAAHAAQMSRSLPTGSRGAGAGPEPQTPSTSANGAQGRVFHLPPLPPLPQQQQQPHFSQSAYPSSQRPRNLDPLPTSSPDPLSLPQSHPRPAAGGLRYTQSQPALAPPDGQGLSRKRSSAALTVEEEASGAEGPASSPTKLVSASGKGRRHSFELVIPTPSPKAKGKKKKEKEKSKPKIKEDEQEEDETEDELARMGETTPRGPGSQPFASQPLQQQQHGEGQQLGLGAPFPFGAGSGDGLGVESGIKRFKLDSAQPLGRTPGTGASSVKQSAVVEKLDDLLSDLFAADDGFVADTSSAAVGGGAGGANVHRSPSRRAGSGKQHSAEVQFFRTTALSASSSLPLLHTNTLKLLLRHLRTVAAKGKAEEFLEAVEEGGVGRLLKVVERSWEGLEGEGAWEGWEREAGEARDEDGAGEVDAKGKGKGKAKGGKKAPAKAAKGKGKGKKAVALEEDDDELDEDEYSARSSVSPSKGGPSRRSSRTPSPSRSPSHALPSSPADAPSSSSDGYWTPSRLSTALSALRTLTDALLALRVALEVLTLPLPPATPLPKHLFSSDFLAALVGAVRRSALEGCFIPLLEAPPTSALAELQRLGVVGGGVNVREKVAEVAEGVQGAVEALARLVRREELGEELVISLAYLGLEPFFHDVAPSASSSKSSKATSSDSPLAAAAKTLRMSSLSLVQALYGRYGEQRQWMLEEVLGNLGRGEVATGGGKSGKGRGAIRLRTGSSIRTISALLLHLVQTPPADLSFAVRKKLAKAARAAEGVDGNGDSQMVEVEVEDELGMGLGGRLGEDGEVKEGEGDEDEGAEVLESISRRLLDPAAESAQKAARTIVGFLLQRSAKAGKTASGTADSEYRAVLDHLITDLLATLHLPEWPAAEVLLGVCCRSMMATLADPKSTHEGNALKALALEYLGLVAARIRSDLGEKKGAGGGLREAVANGDVDALEKVFASQKALLEHLESTKKTGGTGEAASFLRLTFARDLLSARDQANAFLAKLGPVEADSSEDVRAAVAVVERLEVLAKDVWEKGEGENVFGPSPEDAQPRIDALALDLWRLSSLAMMYEPLLERIVDASESAQVALRTKALRAVSLVVAQDPELFHQANVRRSIENRMLDASPAVRDAAIELVGKYVVGRPDLAKEYLPKLGERISDTGVSVRRRVVKLLRALYHVVEDEKDRIDICRRLVYRVLDEDDGVKEIAVEAIEVLWFSPPPKSSAVANAPNGTDEITRLAQVVMQTTGVFKDRPPPVDEALRMIVAKHTEKGTHPPLDRVKEVMESLIDGLVEDEQEMDVVAAVKTVHALAGVDASLLSTVKATLLLPFLKSATTVEEQAVSDCLLKVFRAAVVAQPKTASKFGKDLENSLTPMLNKPSSNPATMQEVIACFCAVVHTQTQNFAWMIRIFKITLERLKAEAEKLSKPDTAKTVNIRQVPILCYMTALLCEHGDFDKVRDEQPASKAMLNTISPKSIAEHVFAVLVRLHSLHLPPGVKSAILTSLGFLYRAHPTLMLHASSTEIMDAIFASPDKGMHLRVLSIVQDFLASQERASALAAAQPVKKKKVEQGVKMEELVGNVEGFADSGVASAIAQRYLQKIIDSSLSTDVRLQRVGVDLISTIARSGFSHPITLSPTLVALTASADPQLVAKAYSTLSLIHQKHASLLATRFLEPARAAHAYVKASAGEEPVRGYRGDPPEALLARWFSLLHKEKRQVQLDYLKTLARSFEVEAGAACSENDVSFARFIAEALSTLDYKRNEEPLLIILYLNSVLAVSGLQVLHHLEQDLAGGGGLLAAASGRGASASPKKAASSDTLDASMDSGDTADKAPSADLARQSVISGLALLLRDHLKHVYSITDAKLAKYVLGKKSPMGDKAVTRRAEAPLALGLDGYERMPFALKPLSAKEDLIAQRETYRRLIAEDGTIGALEELEHDDDE